MKRLLPSPWLSLGLLYGWLLLTRSFSLGQVLLGVSGRRGDAAADGAIAAAPRSAEALRVLVRLILRVGRDVLWSAAQVAAGVWRAKAHPPRGCFRRRSTSSCATCMPSAALTMITAVVPGTVWAELAPDRSALLIHVFDLDDEARRSSSTTRPTTNGR